MIGRLIYACFSQVQQASTFCQLMSQVVGLCFHFFNYWLLGRVVFGWTAGDTWQTQSYMISLIRIVAQFSHEVFAITVLDIRFDFSGYCVQIESQFYLGNDECQLAVLVGFKYMPVCQQCELLWAPICTRTFRVSLLHRSQIASVEINCFGQTFVYRNNQVFNVAW